MYNPLTDEEIKNNIRSMCSCIEDKSVIELAIKSLYNMNLSSIGSLTPRELDVLRERFGINETKTPKTLAEIGEKYGLTGQRIRSIEARAKRILLTRIIKFKSNFKLDELELSDNAKEFLFSSNIFFNFGTLKDFFEKNPGNNETNELREIRETYNKYIDSQIELQKSESITIELNTPIENCNFSVRVYNNLKRARINTVKDLMFIFKDGTRPKIRNFVNNSYIEVENFLSNFIEEKQNKAIDMKKQATTEDNNIFVTQTEDLSIEDVVEKQQDENSIIRERIEKKEELLKKYKKVSDEKTELLEKEKQLDDELKSIMEKIKSSYMEKENDRTKK